MTIDYLNSQKEKYQQKQEYFQKLGFDNLASDFKEVVDLINKMEKYVEEKQDGKT